jgi:hypothetical protein
MIKVPSGFLAIVMLAVLAFTGVTITSTFAQPLIRPYGQFSSPLGPMPKRFQSEPRFFETPKCDAACQGYWLGQFLREQWLERQCLERLNGRTRPDPTWKP